MGTFSDNLDLRWGMENHIVKWTLLQDYTYTSNDGTAYIAPSGFKTDLASIPQLFWTFLPPFWRYAKAAVIHDWIIEGMSNPKLAHEIFREAMISLGVNRQQIFIIYNGVRLHFWLKETLKKL